MADSVSASLVPGASFTVIWLKAPSMFIAAPSARRCVQRMA